MFFWWEGVRCEEKKQQKDISQRNTHSERCNNLVPQASSEVKQLLLMTDGLAVSMFGTAL